MRRKFEVNEPYYAAHWFLARLIPDLVDKVDLSVYIRQQKYKGHLWTFQHYPNLYTMVIKSSIGRRESLRTIAHECVHIAQYATGKMKDIWENNKGKKVLWKKEHLLDNTYDGKAYTNSPWEVEARAMEDKLMFAYLRHVKKIRS